MYDNTKNLAVFGDNFQMNKQKNWKKRVVNFCERNVIGILQILVWVNRIFGLTFGGLVIDSNGSHIEFSVNKYYKFYGFLMAMVLCCVDWVGPFLFNFDPYKFAEHLGLKDMPKMMPIVFGLLMLMWSTFRSVAMYHNNNHGNKLAHMLYKGLDYQVKSLVDLKVILVPVTWTIFLFFTILVSLLWFPKSNIDQILLIIEFISGFICLSSTTSTIWMISLVHSNKLDQIKDCLTQLQGLYKSNPLNNMVILYFLQ